MWANESVFYHIYPLGFCGAPLVNGHEETRGTRIKKVADWLGHIEKLGANAIYMGPIFESYAHGYDTTDYNKIDSRLGTNEDFADVAREIHARGLKLVLDGVFNHVGRDFWAFKDVRERRNTSPYVDWFNISFNGDSAYNDGFWYEGWEGYYNLVKLNLKNDDVVNHIFSAIKNWVDLYDIDGLRLDVAYCLDKQFLRRLRKFCDGLKSEFWLMGEALHGDYNMIMNDEMLHSVTNYECYKGLHSSFNEKNLFEIAYSLNRQFGAENWTLYKNKHLYNFVDNHDVSRIASELRDDKQLPALYALLFTMPGIPSVYYGSEWGVLGDKKQGDAELRPNLELQDVIVEPPHSGGVLAEQALPRATISFRETELTRTIRELADMRRKSKVLQYGAYKNLHVAGEQLVFERTLEDERVIVGINIADSDSKVACAGADLKIPARGFIIAPDAKAEGTPI